MTTRTPHTNDTNTQQVLKNARMLLGLCVAPWQPRSFLLEVLVEMSHGDTRVRRARGIPRKHHRPSSHTACAGNHHSH